MPCHPDRVREQYRCPSCGAVTLTPHMEHVMVPVIRVDARNPVRLGVLIADATEDAVMR